MQKIFNTDNVAYHVHMSIHAEVVQYIKINPSVAYIFIRNRVNKYYLIKFYRYREKN